MEKIPVGTVICGKYRIVSEPVVSGGTSVIYKVHHLDWDMDMSMKIPREDALSGEKDMQAVIRECELWTELGANPYINSCYYAREINGRPVIFSEWTDGISLAEYISSGRLYTGSENEILLKILDISIQALFALSFSHSHIPPVIHGDVKPDNIIIRENGEVKLTDFGLSAGRGGYTDKFCSPEQKNGKAVAVSSDIYSWAVTVMAMYSGKITWGDGIEAGVCCREIFGMCRVQPSEKVKEILTKCLDAAPEKRPAIQNISDLLIELYESELSGGKYERINFQNEDKSDEIADYLNNRALCCLDTGETDKAAEYWQTALELMPHHPESMYNYGVYLVETGKLDHRDLCKRLREEKIKDCESFIEEIKRTYSLSYAGSIEVNPIKIFFNEDSRRILCFDGKARVYDALTCGLINEYPCLEELPDPDDWLCVGGSRRDSSITVKAADNRAYLYKAGCRLYSFGCSFGDCIYSLSPDGALLAVSEGEECVIYKMPEKRRCRPLFNKTASYAELLQYQKEYDRCCAETVRSMGNQNFAAALSAVDRMGRIPFYGKTPFYFRQKKALAKHCKRTDPSVFCVNKSDIRITAAAFSPDSDYIAAVSGNTVYVLLSENLECISKVTVDDAVHITQLEFDDSDSMVYIYTDNKRRSCPLIFDTESRSIERSSTLRKRPDISENAVPEEVGALLPDNTYRCISPDGFSVLVWNDEFTRIYRLDYELVYINKTPFPAPFLSKDKAWIYGACDKNAFLFDLLTDEQLEHIRALSEIQLENPSIRFSDDAKKAKEYLDTFGDDASSHKDPRIRYMIECSDEEYEDIMNECKRQSSFWNNNRTCSFMTLYMRTLLQAVSARSDMAHKADKAAAPEPADEAKIIPHTSAKDKRRTELTQMAQRIHNMRETLLGTVLGQDHAVHVVAEGLFNSEVLAAADTDRKRPRAIFTFAGPPGVGKTMLAEQAAEYLGIPFKRFDMSEYSDEHAYEGLIGFDYVWKNASPGKLTTFVKENPHSILLFDEFEKSHKKTIQIFYQLLDAGVVTDRYYETRKIAAENNSLRSEDEGNAADALNTDAHISFKDTIIIFTTNAGRSLYENDFSGNNSGISAKMLLNALKTEIDPITHAPYFPDAIVSRMATGYPLLFNHLMPHHLVGIIENEYKKCRELINKQYNITIHADKNVLLALLYSAGGGGDARSISTMAANFFRSEFYKLVTCRYDAFENISNVYFRANTKRLPQDIAALFGTPEKTEILIYGSELLISKFTAELPEYIIHGASSVDEAVSAAQEKNINFVIIDISHKSVDSTMSSTETDSSGTIISSIAAKTWHDGKRLFGRLMDTVPEIPIYLLEKPDRVIDNELLSGFVRLGARGKLTMLSDNSEGLAKQISEISHELYMQNIAANMAQQHKALTFETAPKYSDNDLIIDMCGFELERVVDADDMEDMLTDAEKPKERFDDIIGAGAAKKELKYFVDYLRDPRKFVMQGHRLPKGILLYGKPGTGKTMLAKALAGESDITFIPAAASSFVNQYAGSGPAAVRELFRKARRYAPSIIFIDEVDAVARQRTGDTSTRTAEETLNALLIEMDGFSVDPKRPVFVLAATNFEVESGKGGIGVLDEAFVRRFDRKICIELPNKAERKQLLELLISKLPKHNISEAAIENIAARSLGMSPAIITNVVETARRTAFDTRTVINDAILEEAYEQTKFGEKKDWGEKYLLRVARHEAGHAIINYLCGNIPEYLTIEARSNYGGYTEYSEEQRSSPMLTRSELIDRIRMALGGRAAEIIYYGESEGVSTGPSGDLESATATALSMLIYYGMDKSFGLATVDRKTAMESPEIRKRVNEILDEELENSIRLLNENKDLADALVDDLLKKNRLSGHEISELLQNVRSTVKT
ncbi:MAG: AAA family ATPase [Oscillospiraceae bacterium]|nr:AAA family ATPase [Oscillospiraceae bacterium]